MNIYIWLSRQPISSSTIILNLIKYKIIDKIIILQQFQSISFYPTEEFFLYKV